MSERVRAATLPLPPAGAPPRPHVPTPTRVTLDNGLRLVAIPWGTLPQVVLRLVLPGGSVCDPPAKPGTATFAGQLLIEGTEQRDAEQLNAELDRLGASVDVHMGHDFAEVELSLLGETLPEALELFADLVVRPAFPREAVERVRGEALDALAARHDEPANVADDRLTRAIFGDAHPYGRPSVGTEEGVAAATREELRAFHAEVFRPDGAVLVAAGQFDVDDLARRLERVLGDWIGDAARPERPEPPARAAEAGARIRVPWSEAQQAEIRLGGVGLRRASADWIPAAVANYILGGSTITGRLGANLREDKGWTYSARSGFSAAVQPGGWIAETAVDVALREAAVAEMVREIERITTDPVDEEELRRAQRALELSLPRAFETPGRVASRFVTLEAFGLSEDYWVAFPGAVRRVTAEDVLRVSREQFDPARLVQVVVG